VSGTISLEGAPVALTRLRVALTPVSLISDPEMGMERVPVDATGRFTIRGITPARYRVVNSTVLVFPLDRQFWVPETRRIQTAALATDGRYVIRGLPAGEYCVALVDPEPEQQFDHEYLSQLVGASISVTLGDGEKRVQDIRVK
jgi:hypothetical protein